MKTNLLLLDSYNQIEDLIAYAFSFSNRTKRSLKIVYVFDFDWMSQSYLVGAAGPMDSTLVAVERNARKEFDVAGTKIKEVAARFTKKHNLKIPYDIHISDYNRFDTVNDYLNRLSDMILLISNHQSYSEASGGVIGYPNLIEHVNCPVLVIPRNARLTVMKEVIYASDLNPEDLDKLEQLIDLFPFSEGTKVIVFHNEKEYNFDKKLKWTGFCQLIKEKIGDKNLQFLIRHNNDTVQAIEEAVNETNPDLLVMLKEKKGFFKDMFSTSETKNVLTHINKPVMVFHEE